MNSNSVVTKTQLKILPSTHSLLSSHIGDTYKGDTKQVSFQQFPSPFQSVSYTFLNQASVDILNNSNSVNSSSTKSSFTTSSSSSNSSLGTFGQQQQKKLENARVKIYETNECCFKIHLCVPTMWFLFSIFLAMSIVCGGTSFYFYKLSEKWITTNCFIDHISVKTGEPFCHKHSCANTTSVIWSVNFLANINYLNGTITQEFATEENANVEILNHFSNSTQPCKYYNENFYEITWNTNIYPDKEGLFYTSGFFGCLTVCLLIWLILFYAINFKHKFIFCCNIFKRNTEPVSLP